jgi:hypothetical protein
MSEGSCTRCPATMFQRMMVSKRRMIRRSADSVNKETMVLLDLDRSKKALMLMGASFNEDSASGEWLDSDSDKERASYFLSIVLLGKRRNLKRGRRTNPLSVTNANKYLSTFFSENPGLREIQTRMILPIYVCGRRQTLGSRANMPQGVGG